MKAHVHTVPEEIYYVLKGQGEMILVNERIEIKAGMAIFIRIASLTLIIFQNV